MSAAIIEPVAPQNRLRAMADIRNEAPINDAARDEYNDRAYAAVRDLNRRHGVAIRESTGLARLIGAAGRLAGAELVVEAATENKELKGKIFAQVEGLVGERGVAMGRQLGVLRPSDGGSPPEAVPDSRIGPDALCDHDPGAIEVLRRHCRARRARPRCR